MKLLHHPVIERVGRLVLRFSVIVQILLDALAWTAATTAAVYTRLDFRPTPLDLELLRRWIPISASVQIGVGLALGLYRRRWRYGSFDEVAAVAATSSLSTATLFLVDRYLLEPRLVPLSSVIAGGFMGTVTMLAVRYTWRLILERRHRPQGEGSQRLLVYGAGDLGVQLTATMLRTPQSPYLPVAFIDDDPARRRLSVMGVSVLGNRDEIGKVAQQVGATTLLIAVPNASSALINDISGRALAADLDIKVIPPVSELFGTSPNLADIRDLSEADLLGRHEISTDVAAIAGYLRGRCVLVTGAGGSIGSELCSQINQFAPSRLVMLDRDESALHAVQLALSGRALLDSPDLVLCDLRDQHRVFEVFRMVRPDVVFHAAALKHLPLLELYPEEAIKTNVIGTQTVLEAAAQVGVMRFVNISTDKAANPISVLGYSKRIAERLTAHMASQADGTYLSVRFGNVLGSRGSVLTSLRSQIESGGPVTITDPNVTRYFMTIPEAVQLVIQAGAIGSDGEVLVLDMGQPVRIAEVAERLISVSRRPIRIVYTGLRPGEKLHEELLGDGEMDIRPRHPLITHAPVPPLDPSILAEARNHEDIDPRAWLQSLVHERVS